MYGFCIGMLLVGDHDIVSRNIFKISWCEKSSFKHSDW